MSVESSFDFFNSDVWLNYTQERCLPLKDIWFRLDQVDIPQNKWEETKEKIILHRKMAAIPFSMESINKHF